MFSARTRSRDGFTLVELMISAVLAGIFALIVFQLLRGQSRFVALEGAREEVQQNVRGALEVISAELRAVPPAGLLEGSANRIQFLLPRAWGVSCGGGSGTAGSFLFPTLPAGMIPTGAPTGSWGVMGNVGTMAAPVWQASTVALGARSAVNNIASAVVTAAPCNTMGSSGPVQGLSLTGTNFPIVPQGNPAFLFTVVQYDTDVGDGNLYWLRRGTGAAGSQQPLAGPLPASTSLSFKYYDTPNGAAVAAPGTNAATLATIDRVQVFLTTRSRTAASGSVQTQRDSMMVYLRNQ
ncbi:MAG TPA: type II secretion system protein [Longimicrobium sp.]|nr:type II secretion system protein [Longimicrobium sp.]